MIFIALIKPKIDTVSVLVDSFRLSDFNPAIYKPITNCLIGVQHLNIKDTVIVPSCCELLESLGPNLSRLECPLKYLEHELPLMNLDTLVVEFGEDTIDLTPLFSNHLIRRLQMHFLRSYKDDEIVCGDRLLNPSVEELVLTDVHCSSVRLPKRVAKHLPNLKRVIFFFLKTDFWEYKLNDKLISMIECTQKWVQESPNLHFVFYVYVAGSCNENPVGFVRELCKLGVASNEQSFVPIKKIEVDPDIKLCPCYEWEYKMPEILVCLNGQIKFFFWRLQLEKVLDDLYFFLNKLRIQLLIT
ncbi:hypothetical protein M3Y94_00974900 [Aphelenchoides besseyi]|nr:hypothetical protein M3Y94_00974900 [Aphelenchoides besseyi]